MQGRHDRQPNHGGARHKDEHTHEEEKLEKCIGRQGGDVWGGAAYQSRGYNSLSPHVPMPPATPIWGNRCGRRPRYM